MKNSNWESVKVTTTDGMEGVKIIKYIKPISAQRIIGMNIFKDLFTSFSDVFGGYSDTYQKSFKLINIEVIDQIKREAYNIGANCVVGLRIDNDEISGKQKSMIMVTANGTAVIANIPEDRKEIISKHKVKMLSDKDMKLKLRIKEMISNSKLEDSKFDNQDWEFIIENEVMELAPFMLDVFLFNTHDKIKRNTDQINNEDKQIVTLFTRMDKNIAISILYDRLILAINIVILDRLQKLIVKMGFIDYSRIHKMLKHNNFNVQKAGLLLISHDKHLYETSDIARLSEAVKIILGSFPDRVKFKLSKKFPLTKQKEIWLCSCGNPNDLKKNRCEECFCDRKGFESNEQTPSRTIEILNSKIEILNETLSKE